MLEDAASRCDFPTSGAVDCAVSGGADSLALMVLACHVGLDVTAIHVDHGLRPGSADEAEVVRSAARRFGAGFRAMRVEVGDGPNLEARARRARYDALPTGVLTGHTADDQAETVLLQLLRGGGLDGSAGIRPDRRPLLALRRSETVSICQQSGLTPVVDPSNLDKRFRRNRIRHEVMPLLNDVSDRDVVPLLARAAAVARVDVDFLNQLAADIDVTDLKVVRSSPEAIVRRALRLWLGGEHPPDAATIDRALDVVNGRIRSTEVGGGWVLRRSKGTLSLTDTRQE